MYLGLGHIAISKIQWQTPKIQPNYYIKTEFYLNKFLEILLSKVSKKGIMVSSGFMD